MCLQDARQPQLHHWFVKRAVALAMDKHDKEREMTSVLLCSLHNTVCPSSSCIQPIHPPVLAFTVEPSMLLTAAWPPCCIANRGSLQT